MGISNSDYTVISPFKAWVQKTLPTIYDDSLSYADLLSKILNYLNGLINNNNLIINDVNQLYSYVNNYFDNLDVQNEINNKLDSMAESGELDSLIAKVVNEQWQTEIVWIGDSYTQAGSLGNNNKRFSKLVSDMLGLNENNYGVGGTGFIPYGSDVDFYKQCVNAVTDLSSKKLTDKVKYVIVSGGRNDANHYPDAKLSTYNTNIQKINTYLKQNFKYAQIIFIPMLFDYKYLPATYYKAYNYMMRCCTLIQRTIPDAFTILTGHKDYILSDNVHPNEAGHALIAGWIYNGIFGNVANVQTQTLYGDEKIANSNSYIEVKNNTELHINIDFEVTQDYDPSVRIPLKALCCGFLSQS